MAQPERAAADAASRDLSMARNAANAIMLLWVMWLWKIAGFSGAEANHIHSCTGSQPMPTRYDSSRVSPIAARKAYCARRRAVSSANSNISSGTNARSRYLPSMPIASRNGVAP